MCICFILISFIYLIDNRGCHFYPWSYFYNSEMSIEDSFDVESQNIAQWVTEVEDHLKKGTEKPAIDCVLET